MFRNDPQRLSISVLNSTVLEALSLLETAALLGVFALRTSTTVPCFGSAGGLLDGLLALIALHFAPLATNELEHLLFAPRTDGFLGALGRNPKAALSSMWAAWVGDVLFTLDFAQADGARRHEQAFEVWLEDGSVLWNTAA